jgi:hypothetical protein
MQIPTFYSMDPDGRSFDAASSFIGLDEKNQREKVMRSPLSFRAARFFLTEYTKTGENIPNCH